jgi:hypothetical protein
MSICHLPILPNISYQWPMVFRPGESGNPRGRKPGSRVIGKATKLSLREIANRGDIDTIDFLSAVVSAEGRKAIILGAAHRWRFLPV